MGFLTHFLILVFSENLERWPREGCSPFFLPATETIPSFINHFEEMCKEHMHRFVGLVLVLRGHMRRIGISGMEKI